MGSINTRFGGTAIVLTFDDMHIIIILVLWHEYACVIIQYVKTYTTYETVINYTSYYRTIFISI